MLQQLALLLLVTYASSSHYRGGSISWDIRQTDYVNNSATVPVRIHQRHSWRRSAAPSFWSTPECDASTIANGSALIGEDYLRCTSSNCFTSVPYPAQTISTQVLCTDFSVDYDYASGEKYSVLQLPINKRLTYTFASCCWIGLLPLPQSNTPSWALNLVIDTHLRVDGKFNSAPVSTMNPIVQAEVGGTYTINIPMADIDGDQLRCRWGSNESESGGIYQSKGNLQSNPCQLIYQATTIGYEGVAVVIEDFDSNNQVLSSVPLQFLIQIVPLPPTTTTARTFPGDSTVTSETDIGFPPCLIAPEYEGDLPPGACTGVASNNMTEIRVVVKIPCANSSTSIGDILTISPTGMKKGPITQDQQDPDEYIMYLQWTPQANQYGIHQLCVTPVDNGSRSGQTVCFNFLVDVHSPQFVLNSMSPTGTVPQNQSTWTIATDVDIGPPIDPSVSAVFFKRDRSATVGDIEVIRVSMSTADYQPRQITFDTENITWEQGQEYYILLDAGVATINQSCGIQSTRITDTEFWTFSIVAAPIIAKVTTATSLETTTTTASEESNTTTTIPQETTTATFAETTAEETTTTTILQETTTTTPQEITTTTPAETTTTTISQETTTTTPEDTTTTTAKEITTTSTPQTTTTTIPEETTTITTTARTTKISSSSTTTTETTTATTTLTTSTSSDLVCPEWLLFGTTKNITTNDNQRNYSFCFYVNTTLADVTILANTWTPCAIWKISGAADPLMDLYNITNNLMLLAQNDDGNSIPQLNCYASVISYRLYRGTYRVVVRHPKCNYGKFELRLSAETTNAFK